MNHPSPVQIDQWIRGSLDHVETQELEAHVDTCPACQQMISQRYDADNGSHAVLQSAPKSTDDDLAVLSDCLTDETLVRYRDGVLPAQFQNDVRSHLDFCQICAEALRALPSCRKPLWKRFGWLPWAGVLALVVFGLPYLQSKLHRTIVLDPRIEKIRVRTELSAEPSSSTTSESVRSPVNIGNDERLKLAAPTQVPVDHPLIVRVVIDYPGKHVEAETRFPASPHNVTTTLPLFSEGTHELGNALRINQTVEIDLHRLADHAIPKGAETRIRVEIEPANSGCALRTTEKVEIRVVGNGDEATYVPVDNQQELLRQFASSMQLQHKDKDQISREQCIAALLTTTSVVRPSNYAHWNLDQLEQLWSYARTHGWYVQQRQLAETLISRLNDASKDADAATLQKLCVRTSDVRRREAISDSGAGATGIRDPERVKSLEHGALDALTQCPNPDAWEVQRAALRHYIFVIGTAIAAAEESRGTGNLPDVDFFQDKATQWLAEMDNAVTRIFPQADPIDPEQLFLLATVSLTRALVYHEKNQMDLAHREIESAIKHYGRLRQTETTLLGMSVNDLWSAALRQQGRQFLSQGRTSHATARLWESHSASPSQLYRLLTDAHLARALYESGHTDYAVQVANDAANLADTYLDGLSARELRGGFLAKPERIFPFEILVDHAVHTGDVLETLRLTERIRSQAMLTTLLRESDFTLTFDATDAVTLSNALITNTSTLPQGCLPLLETVINVDRAGLNQIPASIRSVTTQMELHDLQACIPHQGLPPNTTVLALVRSGLNVFGLVLNEFNSSIVTLPLTPEEFISLATQVTDELRATPKPWSVDRLPNGMALTAALGVLFDEATQNTPLNDNSRWIIVPFGPLNGIAWTALPYNGKPLIESVLVSVAPSCVHLTRSLAGRTTDAPTRVYQPGGAADPDFPFRTRERERLAETGIGVQLLADTHVEPPAPGLGLHIHGHGTYKTAVGALADRLDPIPAICLSRCDSDTPTLLLAHDIPSSAIPWALVTLSVCQAGNVAVYPGGEVYGLAASFLMAGAGAVVAPLWPVEGATAMEFMTGLYGGLAAGQDKSRSIRSAVQRCRDQGIIAGQWAAFQLFAG